MYTWHSSLVTAPHGAFSCLLCILWFLKIRVNSCHSWLNSFLCILCILWFLKFWQSCGAAAPFSRVSRVSWLTQITLAVLRATLQQRTANIPSKMSTTCLSMSSDKSLSNQGFDEKQIKNVRLRAKVKISVESPPVTASEWKRQRWANANLQP